MEGSHCIGVDGARGVGLGGNRQGSTQVIDGRRFDFLHHVQYMVEVPQVSSHQFNLVEHVAQPLGIRADMENDRSLLSSFEQQTHHFCAYKTCAAGNQYCHATTSFSTQVVV